MLRRLRGRFGIAAPQVLVRTHIPWHLRVTGVASILALVVAIAVVSFDAGRQMGGYDQVSSTRLVDELKTANAASEEELARLRSLLAARESSLEIERASQKLLTERNGLLTAENTRLKEELAIFERLARLESGPDDTITLDRVIVKAESPGLYRYSFLIALQGARRGKETKLNLQVHVSGRGSNDKIILPQRDDPDPGQYEIALRNFRRIDGKVSVPGGFAVSEVEIKILEAGQMKASKKIAL
jgi:hypothetical protein